MSPVEKNIDFLKSYLVTAVMDKLNTSVLKMLKKKRKTVLNILAKVLTQPHPQRAVISLLQSCLDCTHQSCTSTSEFTI